MNTKKQTILIVENDPTTSELFRGTAQTEGYECQSCESAEEALNRIQEGWKHQHFHDIILLDIHLNGMDGADLCEIIRGNTTLPGARFEPRLHIPSWIIATSSDTTPITMKAMLRAGADDFLPKPAHVAAIRARLMVATTALKRYQSHRRAHLPFAPKL